MTLEDKKEIVKAYFYKFDEDFICDTYDISKEEFKKIVEENKDYLAELEEVINGYEEGN